MKIVSDVLITSFKATAPPVTLAHDAHEYQEFVVPTSALVPSFF